MSGLRRDAGGRAEVQARRRRFTRPSRLGRVRPMQLLGQRAPGRSGSTNTPPNGGLYPHMWLMPSGRIIVAGPFREDTWLFTGHGRDDLSWRDVPDMPRAAYGARACGPPGGTGGSIQVVRLGPASPTRTTCAVESDRPAPEQRSSASTRAPRAQAGRRAGALKTSRRAHHNTVLLPDGAMVTIGGGGWASATRATAAGGRFNYDACATAQVELWDPAPARGGSGRRRPSTARITRPRCCCRTGASCRRATTSTAERPRHGGDLCAAVSVQGRRDRRFPLHLRTCPTARRSRSARRMRT